MVFKLSLLFNLNLFLNELTCQLQLFFSNFAVQAVNEIEALKHSVQDQQQFGSDIGSEEMRTQEFKTIHRNTNRISLTCRLVLKVHKKLFKF